MVDKLLVTLSERYKTKISYLKDTKDLSQLIFAELINSLQAMDQMRAMRKGDDETKVEGTY